MDTKTVTPGTCGNRQNESAKSLMLNGYIAIQHCTQQPAGARYMEEMQLIFVKRGTFSFINGKTRFEIGEHQAAILKKNIWVEYLQTDADELRGLEYLIFTIKCDLVKEFIQLVHLPCMSTGIEPTPVVVKQEDKDWLPYMESLDPFLKEYVRPQPGLIRLKLFELLFYIAGKDRDILEQILDLREHYRTNITATVEENVTSPVSMERLASLSGRSLSSFRRDFVAIYNMPPAQWFRQKRLEKARQMMLATTMTVTDVCYTLGFESVAHFSRLFKSHFGSSPSDYKSKASVA